MFNIYEQQKEPKTEDAKVRFLLKKTQCTGLESAVSSLRARMTTEPAGTITFAVASNHLASCVSDLPDYVAKHRNISSVKLAPSSGINKPDGSIHTGFYPNWRSLSKEDRDKVAAERKRLKAGKKARGQPSTKIELEILKRKLNKNKRQISALKNKVAGKNDKDDGKSDGDASSEDVGDSFGGKRTKKAKSKKE